MRDILQYMLILLLLVLGLFVNNNRRAIENLSLVNTKNVKWSINENLAYNTQILFISNGQIRYADYANSYEIIDNGGTVYVRYNNLQNIKVTVPLLNVIIREKAILHQQGKPS